MKQVLIVEDQRMPRENMERIIADSTSYELAASISSAELAIIKCQRQHIDLVLMDVCTTGSKDGIDAAAEIKKQFPSIKIIIVTSMVEVGYLDRAKAAGEIPRANYARACSRADSREAGTPRSGNNGAFRAAVECGCRKAVSYDENAVCRLASGNKGRFSGGVQLKRAAFKRR